MTAQTLEQLNERALSKVAKSLLSKPEDRERSLYLAQALVEALDWRSKGKLETDPVTEEEADSLYRILVEPEAGYLWLESLEPHQQYRLLTESPLQEYNGPVLLDWLQRAKTKAAKLSLLLEMAAANLNNNGVELTPLHPATRD